MSIRVRLIGGLNDGEVIKVDHDQVEIVRSKATVMAAEYQRAVTSLSPASMEIRRARYTRRVVKTPGGDVTYFALESMSDFAALQHVLGP